MSTGLLTTNTIAVGLGPAALTSRRICTNRSVLRLIRSSRDSSGLRRKPGGDADHIAVGNVLVAATADDLIGNARTAVLQVQRLADRQFLVDVQQRDLACDTAALQCKRSTRADQSAAANDRNFHEFSYQLYSCQ